MVPGRACSEGYSNPLLRAPTRFLAESEREEGSERCRMCQPASPPPTAYSSRSSLARIDDGEQGVKREWKGERKTIIRLTPVVELRERRLESSLGVSNCGPFSTFPPSSAPLDIAVRWRLPKFRANLDLRRRGKSYVPPAVLLRARLRVISRLSSHRISELSAIYIDCARSKRGLI